MARQKPPSTAVAGTASPAASLELPTPGTTLMGALWALPILLFVAASAYGVLEVHSSTDTWIGLAAGKQILESDKFPLQDTFSYTFNGQLWYNQNWLTHVMQYWIYANISPNAVVYFTWLMASSIFLMSMLACWYRSGSWLGSVLAATVVALGSRDFLSARPATTGFFCISALWMLICAIEGQGTRRRYWPIGGLFVLLLFWGNAHGSFVFAYGMLGLYVAYRLAVRVLPGWLHAFVLPLPFVLMSVTVLLLPRIAAGLPADPSGVPLGGAIAESAGILKSNAILQRFLVVSGMLLYPICAAALHFHRPRVTASIAQILGIAAVIVVTIPLLIAISPFGLGNFIHPGKVAGSELFRTVSEWRPPFEKASFPPVWRFKLILAWCAAVPIVAWAVCAFLGMMFGRPKPSAEAARSGPQWNVYDVGAVLIGLTMTLWARRFAPMFFIFAAPMMVVWVSLAAQRVQPAIRQWCQLGIMALAGVASLGVIWETGRKATNELVKAFENEPTHDLLDRVTRYDATPHNAILFLQRNEVGGNALVEWTQAGPVMFFAPGTRVFMDGRAQQVYTEEHYRKYMMLFHTRGNADQLRRVFDLHAAEAGTDIVLLRRSAGLQTFFQLMEQWDEWTPVLYTRRWTLFFKKDGEAYARLKQRAAAGTVWFPDTPESLLARGSLLVGAQPPKREEAIKDWAEAVKREPKLAKACFPLIGHTYAVLGQSVQGRLYFEMQARWLQANRSRLAKDVIADFEQALRNGIRMLDDGGTRELPQAPVLPRSGESDAPEDESETSGADFPG